MQDQLRYLVQLQQLDKAIEQIFAATEENPHKIKQIDMETQEIEAGHQAFIKEMEGINKQRRDLEREVEEYDQKIKKSQVKLMEVKTNKEYRAMLTEIDELKKGKTGKEDLLLEFLEKMEDGVQKQKELKKSVETQIAEGKRRKATLEQEGRVHKEELAALNQKRGELTSRVEAALLRQYEFLRDRLKGVAVAEVKEAACRGCHMQIPPQLYNDLHRQDRIIACPSCLRLLYFSGPENNQEA